MSELFGPLYPAMLQDGAAVRFFQALADIQSLEQRFAILLAERQQLRDSTNLNDKTSSQVPPSKAPLQMAVTSRP